MLLDRSLSFIVTTSWTLFGVIMVLYFIRLLLREWGASAVMQIITNRVFAFVFVGLVALTVLSESLVFIEPNQVGVVISIFAPDGYRDRPLRSGLHWIIPFAEQVFSYSIAFQTYTMAAQPNEGAVAGNDSIAARTNDGQEVFIDCSILFRIDPEQAVQLHINWQERYVEDFVRPLLRGLVRNEVAKYNAVEVNSGKRNDLENDLSEAILEALVEKGLIMDRFLLRSISFSPEFAEAIELKQVAEQEVLRREFQAEQLRAQARGEADQIQLLATANANAIRLRAEAEAAALERIALALAENDDLITYRYVEKLAPNIKVMLVPNTTPYILPLPDMEVDEPLTETVTSTVPLTSTTPITPTVVITP